ncbi:hypothetical protein [Streptomyces sp. ADI96-02]|uniref:hypothetical protein n=1 Tax=Streptomyces sp. ADI96-02 TaxID=1522760 RepID=UPI001F14D60A|nr:hypothetical protein [Streptomyces sp. ADI96-02]
MSTATNTAARAEGPDRAADAAPELSCYTANLVAYLEAERPDAADRLADAIALAVRTDLPDGRLAFRHHARIDTDGPDGPLVHRGAARWADALAGLRHESALRGRVLAVANTRHVPWSPAHGRSAVSHWVLLERARGHGDRWRVTDRFAALLPDGEQLPYSGVLDDDELRRLLTPVGELPYHNRARDVHALGGALELPEPGHYGWLAREARTAERPPAGRWLTDPLDVLRFLAARLGEDPAALAAHADDLWAASRHQRHRLDSLVRRGRTPAPPADAAAHSWGELPRSLRFAATSAERGRPRPGVVAKAFEDLIDAMTALQREAPTR